MTLLLHGEEGLELAERSTRVLYSNDLAAMAELSLQDTRELFQQADYIQKLYHPGISVLGKDLDHSFSYLLLKIEIKN